MIGVAARRLLARAVAAPDGDATALVAARRAFGSWRRLAEALRAERLAALLGWRLRGGAGGGNNRFRRDITAVTWATLATNLRLRKNYEAIRATLAAEGIPALGLKGVDVAFAVYPNPGCRPMADVDILVSPDNYRAAQEVLVREGFTPLPREPRWWPGRSFCRRGEVLDVHWSPAAAMPPRRGMAALCYFAGGTFTIKEEFRLLVSVCHHQNHFFSLPLLYYWETALLARRVSWPVYTPLARRWGAARATRFVLALARSFFGGPPSPGRFNILKTLASPALGGGDLGRGTRAAAAYAVSLDNPAAALASGFRRPAWARDILTRSSSEGESL